MDHLRTRRTILLAATAIGGLAFASPAWSQQGSTAVQDATSPSSQSDTSASATANAGGDGSSPAEIAASE